MPSATFEAIHRSSSRPIYRACARTARIIQRKTGTPRNKRPKIEPRNLYTICYTGPSAISSPPSARIDGLRTDARAPDSLPASGSRLLTLDSRPPQKLVPLCPLTRNTRLHDSTTPPYPKLCAGLPTPHSPTAGLRFDPWQDLGWPEQHGQEAVPARRRTPPVAILRQLRKIPGWNFAHLARFPKEMPIPATCPPHSAPRPIPPHNRNNPP